MTRRARKTSTRCCGSPATRRSASGGAAREARAAATGLGARLAGGALLGRRAVARRLLRPRLRRFAGAVAAGPAPLLLGRRGGDLLHRPLEVEAEAVEVRHRVVVPDQAEVELPVIGED